MDDEEKVATLIPAVEKVDTTHYTIIGGSFYLHPDSEIFQEIEKLLQNRGIFIVYDKNSPT